jgi:carbonic anhydrase/acetyltransferase-like protein (isoleucine patch superfamily)
VGTIDNGFDDSVFLLQGLADNGRRLPRFLPGAASYNEAIGPGGAGPGGAPMQLIRDYYVAPGAVVTGDVVLAAGVNIWFATVVRGDLARITLGPRVNLQDGCVVHTDHGQPLEVEEGVVVGHRAVLHGRFIGRDTLVGMGALLLTGCEVGAECVIAAGALVTKRRIPPRSVVMGVPGRVVREVTADDLRRTQAIAAHYLELAQRYAHGSFPPPWAHMPA